MGESLARDYLESRGYSILHSNYRTRFGEIDLTFLDGNVLVFAEVKYRRGRQLQPIEESITKRKINRILKSAEIYMDRSKISCGEMRIDAILIEEKGQGPTIRHIKNFY